MGRLTNTPPISALRSRELASQRAVTMAMGFSAPVAAQCSPKFAQKARRHAVVRADLGFALETRAASLYGASGRNSGQLSTRSSTGSDEAVALVVTDDLTTGFWKSRVLSGTTCNTPMSHPSLSFGRRGYSRRRRGYVIFFNELHHEAREMRRWLSWLVGAKGNLAWQAGDWPATTRAISKPSAAAVRLSTAKLFFANTSRI